MANMSPREPACPLISPVQISGATSRERTLQEALDRYPYVLAEGVICQATERDVAGRR